MGGERKPLLDRAIRRTALAVSKTRGVGDRVRNGATLAALRRSSDIREVGEVFEAGLRDATRRKVKLTIDAGVDVHATKRIAMMTVQLLRQHRGLTDLGDVRINAPHANFESSSIAEVNPNFGGTGGSTLWFNSQCLQPGKIAELDADIVGLYRSGSSTPAYRYGLEGVVAHEVGHLIGNAATLAARGTHLQNALAQRTVNSLEPWQRAQVGLKVNQGYRTLTDWLQKAPPQEIILFNNARLNAEGVKPDPMADPEHIRSETLAGLPDRYYGAGPRNELSGASAEKVTSRYAAKNAWEQHGESFAAVMLLGAKADAASHATYKWMTDALNHKYVDHSREYLNRRDVLIGDAKEAGALAPGIPPMPAYAPMFGPPPGVNPLGGSPLPGSPSGVAPPQPQTLDLGIAAQGLVPAADISAEPALTSGPEAGLAPAPLQSLGYAPPSPSRRTAPNNTPRNSHPLPGPGTGPAL